MFGRLVWLVKYICDSGIYCQAVVYLRYNTHEEEEDADWAVARRGGGSGCRAGLTTSTKAIQKSMSLKYEPASEALHNSVK